MQTKNGPCRVTEKFSLPNGSKKVALQRIAMKWKTLVGVKRITVVSTTVNELSAGLPTGRRSVRKTGRILGEPHSSIQRIPHGIWSLHSSKLLSLQEIQLGGKVMRASFIEWATASIKSNPSV
ncbi:hypothetical protein TNIN_301031 [Trichonephila inaurata madagascariensis]|uniref:Uncharacterized protein n=1 Tax=Trichonephila inaurata madagascariensis TaxID=2747483 RepID=A0A8X6MFC3_9ARAC|nr:hypothetical protein TNIN_301031 [Trichonephila inaurata madagascariensis]